ncbi:MAG: siderophore-iron reductase FhuF [Shinella sp.]|jgi:ferric iron reductase protein FhuF|nr:siderophore-iron reductase FhuF [Shinella sp.]
MIPSLAPLFTGDLGPIGDYLVLADDPRPYLSCSDLLDEGRLPELLARFGRNYAEPEPRGVASQWSKWYFSRLLTPVLAANIALNRRLPIVFEETGLILSEDARVVAFRLSDDGRSFEPTDFVERFEDLIDGHLSMLVEALSSASGLSRKVLWSNAGNIFENVVSQCAQLLGEAHPGVGHGRALLANRFWREDRVNRIFEPVRYLPADGKNIRKRRVCCIRYLIPGIALCKNCPLEVLPS